MIVYFAADLIWGVRIKAEAEAAGVSARPVRSVEMLDARLGDSPVSALLVDLDAPDVAISLIRRARQAGPPIRVLAWGPHVAVDALREAKEAGADAVMSRGAFSRRLRCILVELEQGDAPGDDVAEEA